MIIVSTSMHPFIIFLLSFTSAIASNDDEFFLRDIVDTYRAIEERIYKDAWIRSGWDSHGASVPGGSNVYGQAYERGRLRISFKFDTSVLSDDAEKFKCKRYQRSLPRYEIKNSLAPLLLETNFMAVVSKELNYTVNREGISSYPPIAGTVDVSLPLAPKTHSAIFPSREEGSLQQYSRLYVEDLINSSTLKECKTALANFLESRHERAPVPTWHYRDSIITQGQ